MISNWKWWITKIDNAAGEVLAAWASFSYVLAFDIVTIHDNITNNNSLWQYLYQLLSTQISNNWLNIKEILFVLTTSPQAYLDIIMVALFKKNLDIIFLLKKSKEINQLRMPWLFRSSFKSVKHKNCILSNSSLFLLLKIQDIRKILEKIKPMFGNCKKIVLWPNKKLNKCMSNMRAKWRLLNRNWGLPPLIVTNVLLLGKAYTKQNATVSQFSMYCVCAMTF